MSPLRSKRVKGYKGLSQAITGSRRSSQAESNGLFYLLNQRHHTPILCDHPLHQGFSIPERKIHILSESELFGEMRLGTKARKHREVKEAIQFTELNGGDIVVHRDHGLGIYVGLVTMEFQGIKNDFMLIEYRDGDKLYLPVDRMNLISRYEGLSDKQPRIDKLGTQTWKTTKSKIKEEVWKVAHELLVFLAWKALMKDHRLCQPDGAARISLTVLRVIPALA